MYALANQSLTVSILDPQADQARFGTRYCTGGYIFQVEDARLGPLLSGPTYPESFNCFDGQGIPDAFNLGPLREATATDALALVIGVGLCDLVQNQVVEFCRWDVEQSASAITMRTTQSYQDFALNIERTVTLASRTVRSSTRLQCTGKRPIAMRWFPHPFFPQLESDELCRINIPLTLRENPAYVMAASGYIARKGWPWQEGHFQPLDLAGQDHLVVLQKHPLVGIVAGVCSYTPTFFPIWGNQHTFSWEPFLERTVMEGQEAAWSIEYDF